MFDSAHLFACHKGALIPAKKQPRNAHGKSSGISKHDRTRQDNKKLTSRMHAWPWRCMFQSRRTCVRF